MRERSFRERFPGNGDKPRAGGVFVFALLAMFALLSLLIVLVGARVYRTVEENAHRNQEVRTPLMYVANKLRSHDAQDMVEVFQDGSDSVLALGAHHGAALYNTYIFYEDGNLMEYFGKADAGFRRDFGEPVAEAGGFEASVREGLLTVTVTDSQGQGHTLHMTLAALSGEEGE